MEQLFASQQKGEAMLKILIADDHSAITDILVAFAEAEGFTPTVAVDGEEALRRFRSEDFDVILLDVTMPGKDGFTVCREIRKESNVPILMITARGDDYDRIMGLDIGADDYIVKPFSPAEVMARVRAVLRRLERATSVSGLRTLRHGQLVLEEESCRAMLDGTAIPLTRKEFDLLWLLMENKDRTFSREHLLDSLWGYDYTGDTRAVDTHIKRLRAKLEKKPHPGWQIKTVWGVGYAFETIPYHA